MWKNTKQTKMIIAKQTVFPIEPTTTHTHTFATKNQSCYGERKKKYQNIIIFIRKISIKFSFSFICALFALQKFILAK